MPFNTIFTGNSISCAGAAAFAEVLGANTSFRNIYLGCMPLSFIILEIIFGVLNMSWEKPEEGVGPKSLSEAKISYSNHRTFYLFSFSKRRPSAVVLILHLIWVIWKKVAKEGKFQTRVILRNSSFVHSLFTEAPKILVLDPGTRLVVLTRVRRAHFFANTIMSASEGPFRSPPVFLRRRQCHRLHRR